MVRQSGELPLPLLSAAGKCRGFLEKEGKFIASEEKDVNGMITNDVLKNFGPA